METGEKIMDIATVRESKQGQKLITIPKKSLIKAGDIVFVQKIKLAVDA